MATKFRRSLPSLAPTLAKATPLTAVEWEEVKKMHAEAIAGSEEAKRALEERIIKNPAAKWATLQYTGISAKKQKKGTKLTRAEAKAAKRPSQITKLRAKANKGWVAIASAGLPSLGKRR